MALPLLAAAIAAASPAESPEPVELAWKWKPGLSLRYQSDVDIRQTLAQDGEILTGRQRQEIVIRHLVTDVDPDGIAAVRTEYERMTLHITFPGGQELAYDSAAPPDAAAPVHPLVRSLTAMVGESFTMRVSPRGEVLEVAGFDRILEKMTGPLPQGAIRTTLESSGIRDELENFFRVVPGEPVRPGASWYHAKDQVNPLVGPARVRTEFRLERIEEDEREPLARIHAASSLTTPEAPDPLDGLKGVLLFAVQGGYLKSQRVTMVLIPDPPEPSPDADPEAARMPVLKEIRQDISTRLLEAEGPPAAAGAF